MRQRWVGRKDAIAQFEEAWQKAAPDLPLPSDRQIANYFGSGLMAMRYTTVGREYEAGSSRVVAEALATSGGRERLIHATREGPWADLWWLHRRFSAEGVVILGNTAYVERVTDLSRKTLQRVLDKGELPSSQVGYTSFVPVKAVRQWQRAKGGAGPERLRTGELPGQPRGTEPVTVISVDDYFR